MLPDSIGQLKALEGLHIWGCTTLKAIPDSLVLSSLKFLSASHCCSLVKLPISIGQSSLLQVLHLLDCKNLEELPNSIGQLQSLKTLDLDGCTSLKALPDTMGALLNLEYLYANNCSSLVKLPISSLGLLSSLQVLELKASTECMVFSDSHIGATWIRLQCLSLGHFGGSSSLVDYSALKSLRGLVLCDYTLTELPESLGLLVGLKELRIFECERIQMESLPMSFGALKMLKTVILDNCPNLRRLPKNLAALTSLMWLRIDRCPIRRVPKSLCRLSQLKWLDLIKCKNLQKLPTSIKQLKCLRKFTLRGCGSIEAMGALTTLQGLPIWGSTSLTELPASLGMVSHLDICGSDKVYSFEYDVATYHVLEEDETGFLRAYRNKQSGLTTLLRRSHKVSMRGTELIVSSGSGGGVVE